MCIVTFILVLDTYWAAHRQLKGQPRHWCLLHSVELISLTPALIHTKSNLIEASLYIDVHSHNNYNVGRVLGCPLAPELTARVATLSQFCGSNISPTAISFHANSSLKTASACVDVHYHTYFNVGQVMDTYGQLKGKFREGCSLYFAKPISS